MTFVFLFYSIHNPWIEPGLSGFFGRTYFLTPRSRVLLEKLTGFAANQEIPRILRKPKVHHRTHKRPPPILDCFRIKYYLLSLKLTPRSRVLLEKLTGFAANQEIPRILWKPKVHHRTHKRPPPILDCFRIKYYLLSLKLSIYINWLILPEGISFLLFFFLSFFLSDSEVPALCPNKSESFLGELWGHHDI